MTNKQKKDLKRIIVALVLFTVLIIWEHTIGFPGILSTASLVLYLVPYFIAGYDVVKGCLLGIKNRQWLDEKFLMTIATVGAFVTGEFAEGVAVMLFYQVGEFFQSYAVNKSRGSIKELMEIVPEFANIEREDGSIEVVDPDEVEVGNILIIKPGEKVPVDGIVLEGCSMVNTAALTGESVPRSIYAGDQIISGCINGEGLLKVRAEKEFDDSTVAQILEMVENAAEKKSRTENFITRFARYYTPLVVAGALILAIIPPIFVGGFKTWILRACTFLVISCPCALVISVPLSFFGGIGAASKFGILVKGSNYLELMSQIDTIVSDKTGTLTRGEFKVTEILCASDVTEDEVLGLAAAAEALSTHPIANSIREACEGRDSINIFSATDITNVSGEGIVAKVNGDTVLAGNAKLMRANGIIFTEDRYGGATIVYLAKNGDYIGEIRVADSVKPEAGEAIAGMKAEGVKNVVMLTGDRKSVADVVALELGVDIAYSELMPGDKVEKVEELLAGLEGTNKKLAFIGDGINDAPVLSRSDVGIAMGSMGSDAAIEAADIVIMDDDLRKIPLVMRISKKTVGIAKQNIVFALLIKISFLIMGALGIAGMWAAVFADVGVAVICILNSMRMLNSSQFSQNTGKYAVATV